MVLSSFVGKLYIGMNHKELLIENLSAKFRFILVHDTFTILANASNLKSVKLYCTMLELYTN